MSDMSDYRPRREMMEEDLNRRSETWEIRFEGEKVHFSRWIDGKPDELYAPLTLAQGAVAATMIFNGFQPQRRLKSLDIPVEQNESE